MHENVKINAKGRVIQTYRLKERETLQEIWRKTTKKFAVEPCRVGEREREREREESLKTFEIGELNKSRSDF